MDDRAVDPAVCGNGHEGLSADATRVAPIRDRRGNFVPGHRLFGTGDRRYTACYEPFSTAWHHVPRLQNSRPRKALRYLGKLSNIYVTFV